MLVCLLLLNACTTDKAVHLCIGKGGNIAIQAPTFPVGGQTVTDLGGAMVTGPARYSSMPATMAKDAKAVGNTSDVFGVCPWELQQGSAQGG